LDGTFWLSHPLQDPGGQVRPWFDQERAAAGQDRRRLQGLSDPGQRPLADPTATTSPGEGCLGHAGTLRQITLSEAPQGELVIEPLGV
jgi:hypothetical protein